jgi:2',3'-cyclic-nucleotide 2'-phosphodiesterase/3'-nucleotidase
MEDEEDKRLASAFPEIRLIIGGHNHSTLGTIRLGQTVVAKTGSSGRNVGRVDLDFNAKKLVRIDAKLIPVTNVAPDREVTKVLEPFLAKVNVKMAEVVGEATDDLQKSGTVESPLANIVADAFREKGKTQIVIHNTGGIRAKISKGKITWGNIFEVLPFQNTMITLKLTGAQLKKTLERGLVTGIGMAALSGVRVQFDRTKPPGQQVVSLLLTDGTAIDDSKLYSVTTNDFVLAGGDGFTEFAKGTDIMDTGIFLRDVLVDYVKAHRILSPKLDGRILVKEGI